MKGYPYVVSCDWFQMQCLSEWVSDEVVMPCSTSAPHPAEGGSVKPFCYMKRDQIGMIYEADGHSFTVAASLEFQPLFSVSYLVQWRGRPLAHVFLIPKRKDVNPRSCHVKVANSALYSSEWPSLLRSMMRACRFKFVRLVRIDVCADFERFANGRLPLRFVQDYLSKPTATRPSFLRKSSNKLRCSVTKAFDKLLWETLAWGTRDSAVQVNLYNKTLEMMQKVDKVYIREKWKDYGLPSSLDKPIRRWVWRVEFSINCSQKFVHGYDGLLRDLMLDDVASQRALESLFAALVPDFFCFYELTVNDVRSGKRVRDLREVQLFDLSVSSSYRLRSYTCAQHVSQRFKRLASALEGVCMDPYALPKEKEAARLLADRYVMMAKDEEAKVFGRVSADSLLSEFLCDVYKVSKDASYMSKEGRHRELLRLVSMLKGVKCEGFKSFEDGYQKLDAVLEDMRDAIASMSYSLPDDCF